MVTDLKMWGVEWTVDALPAFDENRNMNVGTVIYKTTFIIVVSTSNRVQDSINKFGVESLGCRVQGLGVTP